MSDGPARVAVDMNAAIARGMEKVRRIEPLVGPDHRLAFVGELTDVEGRWWRVTLERI